MSIRNVTLDEAGTQALAHAEPDVAFRMDEDAFRGFYDRTSRMLWVYLQRLTNDRSAADDLLQETYYRFLRANVNLDSESHRRHYLFRIATNLTRDGFRRDKGRPQHVSHDDEGTQVAALQPTVSASLDEQLDLTSAMAQLGQRERALLWLAYAQGATHKEIASVVGVRTGSVKPLLYRARRKLAGLLGGRAGAR